MSPVPNAVRQIAIGTLQAVFFAVACAGALAGMIFTFALTGELQ